jgi:L-fucose isomerase-like protein
MPDARARVRLVFSYPPKPIEGWPYLGYDHQGRAAELTSRLRQALPEIDFVTGPVANEEAAKATLATDRDIDGYLVFITGIPSSAHGPFAYSGRPVVLVDDLYGGTGAFLGAYAGARRKGMPIAGVSSSSFQDVVQAARTLSVMRKLRASAILNVTGRNMEAGARSIQENLGPLVKNISGEELEAAYQKADRAEGRKWARAWTKAAAKVVEPSARDLEDGGAMYLAMLELMGSHKAQGIAVDCLHLFYGGKLTAYPCMGFFQLNDDGLVGACESDIQSAATMLVLTYLTGKPGYISDPVIDTSKNQAIYAHCVAPSKVWGPKGASNPYHIRSHSEDRKGAAVRSLMPLGHMTTTLKFVPQNKAMVIHTGKAVDNIDNDKACRTKLAVEVKDARKLMAEWQYGWHRVTVYGDERVALGIFSDLTGFKVVEEG